MKKAWAAALSLCLLLSLAACGDGGNDGVQRGPAASAQNRAESAADGTETDGGSAETDGGSTPDGAETGNKPSGDNTSGETVSGSVEPGDSTSGTDSRKTAATVVDGVSIQAILDANETETLIASRGSFLMETSYAPEIDTTGRFTEIYADRESIYLKTDSTQELHTDHGAYLFMDGYFGAPLMPELPKRSDFSMILLDREMTSLEEITAVERNGDTLSVHAVLSSDAIQSLGDLASDAYAPGDFTEMTYTLDAADLAVLACSTVLRRADGSSLDMGPMKVTYGAALPENAVLLREHLDGPEQRTMTVVLDPDTEEETTYSTTVRKGDTVFPFLPEGYYILYRDPACTEEYAEGQDGLTEDVVVYSRPLGLPGTLESEGQAVLADAGGEGGEDDPSMYDGASHRHAEDAERDMMEDEAARGNAEGNP